MDGAAAYGYISGKMCSSSKENAAVKCPQKEGEGVYEKKFIYRNGKAA